MEEQEAMKKASGRKQITPEPGFVVRVAATPAVVGGPKLCFINICQHKAVWGSSGERGAPRI